MPGKSRSVPLAVLALTLTSGTAALIYELAWVQRAGLGLGSGALALSTVLAVFFAGLGLGGFCAGRWAPRLAAPWRAFALVEALLALCGAASPWLWDLLEPLYGALYRALPLDSAALLALRAALAAVALLPPTLLMGAGLPLVLRAWVRDTTRVGAGVGALYGANTLGATAGCFLAGFALLPGLGLTATITVAATLNAGVALLAGLLPAPPPAAATPSAAARGADSADGDRPGLALLAALFFISGLVSLGLEVAWARYLSFFTRHSIYSATLSLGATLLGAGLGSALAGRLDRPGASPARLLERYALLQGGAMALTLILTHLPPALWAGFGTRGWLLPFALMLWPSLLAGAAFPVVVRLRCVVAAHAAQEFGRLTAVNTLGCILGAVLAGYLLLPGLGLDGTLYALTAAGGAAAILALGSATQRAGAWRAGPLGLALGGALLWGGLWTMRPVVVPRDLEFPSGKLADYAEGYNSTLAVTDDRGYRTLLVDTLWQGVSEKNYQIMVAHIPMLLAPATREVLVVGLGVGTTASRFLYHPIRRLDVVDIEPALFGFVRRNFAAEWMDDPRVRLLAEDGRSHIRHGRERYDLISVEIGQLDRPGVAAFYTREFYAEARARLNPGGMLVQFVPLNFLRAADLASVLATFRAEFPNAVLWYNTDELLLMGVAGPAPVLDPAAFRHALTDPHLAGDLDFHYWGGAGWRMSDFATFAGGFLSTGPELDALSAEAPAELYHDDRMALSHAVRRHADETQKAVTLTPALLHHLSPLERLFAAGALPDAATRARIDAIRRANVGNIAAGTLLRDIGPDTLLDARAILARCEAALVWNPDNAYARLWRERAARDLTPRP